MNLYVMAEKFARWAHEGQTRKTLSGESEPYINHCIRVANLVKEIPNVTPYMVCAAYLHDVLEDCKKMSQIQLKREIEDRFGTNTLTLVEELTDVFTKEAYPEYNRQERKAFELNRLSTISYEATLIKRIDIQDNLTDLDKINPGFYPIYVAEKNQILSLFDSLYKPGEHSISSFRELELQNSIERTKHRFNRVLESIKYTYNWYPEFTILLLENFEIFSHTYPKLISDLQYEISFHHNNFYSDTETKLEFIRNFTHFAMNHCEPAFVYIRHNYMREDNELEYYFTTPEDPEAKTILFTNWETLLYNFPYSEHKEKYLVLEKDIQRCYRKVNEETLRKEIEKMKAQKQKDFENFDETDKEQIGFTLHYDILTDPFLEVLAQELKGDKTP